MFSGFSGRKLCFIASLVIVSACTSTPPAETADHHQPPVYASQAMPQRADLPRLLAYARQHHPDMQAADAMLAQASAAVTTAGSWADPQLGISLGLDNSDWQTLSLEQEIPSFGRRGLGIDQAKAAQQMARARQRQIRVNVEQRLIQAYAEYAFVLADKNLQQQAEILLQQLADITRSRYETGQATQDQWLRAQNRLDESRTQLRLLDRLQQATATRLNTAMGRNPTTQLPELPELDAALAQMPLVAEKENTLFARLGEQNPALEAGRYQLDSLAAGKRLSEKDGLPRFMLGVQYMDMGGMNDGTTSAMASMSLPIWRQSYRAGREAAEAQYRAAGAQQQSLQLDLQAQLAMALYRRQQAEENRELYGQKVVPRAEQAVASAMESYRQGRSTFLDVLESQQSWLNFSRNFERALADRLLSEAEIHRLVYGVIEVSDEN